MTSKFYAAGFDSTKRIDDQFAKTRAREKADKALVDQFYRELEDALTAQVRPEPESPEPPYQDWHSTCHTDPGEIGN